MPAQTFSKVSRWLVHQVTRIAHIEVRPRIRLRSLLLVMTLFAVAIGLVSAHARHVEATVDAIRSRGAWVIYDVDRPTADAPRVFDYQTARRVGIEWVSKPVVVVFPNDMVVTDEDLQLVGQLGSIETVLLAPRTSTGCRLNRDNAPSDARTGVTDRGLAYLSDLPRLRQLTLAGTSISDTALADFQQARPECLVAESMHVRTAVHGVR